MGQKVNPISLRLGITRTWDSVWYAKKDYADNLHQDLKIREFIQKALHSAGIGSIKIERLNKKLRIIISSSKPGIIVGKKGEEINKVKKFIEDLTGVEVSVNIVEIKKAELDAILIADSIAKQVEERVAYKKAMKRAIQSALKMGAQGIRINIAGRLGGAEIARTEWYKEARVPLHKLRADISFGVSSAHTTYGVIGIKVWVYLGEKRGMDF